MHGFWSAQNEFIGIATQVGTDAIIEMHDRLYRGPLAGVPAPRVRLHPHITLAQATEADRYEALCTAAAVVTRESFRDVLRTVTIIRDNGDGEWVRERDLHLMW